MSLATVDQVEAAPRRLSDKPGPRVGVIRAFEERDLDTVVALHAKYLPKYDRLAEEALHDNLSRLLLPQVGYNKALPSLVYQASDGRITGFLGVVPRPMTFQGRPIMGAISHSFIVEPGSRSAMAALELVRHFLSGPQDLSMAEGGRITRRLWELDGGFVSPQYGLCWTRPLRPSSYMLSFLGRRGLPAAAEQVMKPACRAIDALLTRAKPFRLAAPPVQVAALGGRTLCASLAQFTKGRELRPRYNEPLSTWMLETLGRKKGRGDFHQMVVRNSNHQIIGWYLCFIKAGGMATVLQMGASEDGAEQVLDHLSYFAREQGAIAVSGQADPGLFLVLARKKCIFHHDSESFFLLHSRHPELLQAIHRGDAFLSRLEGEWWISFLLS